MGSVLPCEEIHVSLDWTVALRCRLAREEPYTEDIVRRSTPLIV